MITVIKLGGRVQSDPSLIGAVAALWQRSAGRLCIVHGGGDEISTLQRALGREPSFNNGRRITSAQDIEIVRMVLSGSANKRLVAAFTAEGIPAAGISGEDGSLLAAEPLDDSSRVGKPVSADPLLIETLMRAGFLPVISPVAFDRSAPGETLNVNGDDAAAVIASALGADLWLVSDVAGVKDADGNILASLEPSRVEAMVQSGVVNGGMLAKLEAGFDALTRGAASVRIAGIDALWNDETGTLLSLTPSMR